MRWVYRVKQSQRVIEQNARVLLGEMCHITKTSLPEDQRLADHALITAIFKVLYFYCALRAALCDTLCRLIGRMMCVCVCVCFANLSSGMECGETGL